MEARKIVIVNTVANERREIMSGAETLGELKNDIRAAGMEIGDHEFLEGITRTTLVDDATQLPRGVTYRGQRTDNLIVMMTAPKTKIKNGYGNRQECLEWIGENNLWGEFEGENHVEASDASTDWLNDFVDRHISESLSTEERVAGAIKDILGDIERGTLMRNVRAKLENLLASITGEDAEDVQPEATQLPPRNVSSFVSDEELDQMVEDLCD